MIQRIFYPGDKWLYFKIYSSPINANYLLHNIIQPFTSKWLTLGIINKWFFIRYSDPGHHLRLRIELTDIKYIGTIICDFRNRVLEDADKGVIASIQIDTYKRELERYGENNIDDCENFFFSDSVEVLKSISRCKSDIELLKDCICWLFSLMLSTNMSFDEMKKFLSYMEAQYKMEFILSIQQIAVIDMELRKIRMPILEEMKCLYLQRDILDNTKFWIKTQDSSFHLLSSIIHMHVNRLFMLDQRLYEYIVYHMLLKSLDGLKNILNNKNLKDI